MFLLGDDARLVISASDLRTASACEFALVRGLDVLLGRAKVSSWKGTVREWRRRGGDAIRRENQQALAARSS